ncbi:hypothetical protein PP715_24195, partial [Ralstonia solanacearum]
QRQPQLFADFSSRHASYDNPLLAVGPVMLAALNHWYRSAGHKSFAFLSKPHLISRLSWVTQHIGGTQSR